MSLSLVWQFPYYLYRCDLIQWNWHLNNACILQCFSNYCVLHLNPVFSTDFFTRTKSKTNTNPLHPLPTISNKQTKKSNSKRCLSGVFLTTLLYKEKIGKTLCYLRHLRFGVTDKERHVVDFILYHKVLFFPFEILEIYRRSQLEAFIRVCYLNIPQIKIQFNPQVKTRAVKMNRWSTMSLNFSFIYIA